ncbi:MAG: carbon monoxide dehydrogenase [Pseudorhodobacter sp. PARRP1]|nr:MAG: carbon monoxide dehydrogenase [Pseudorhodobacter sp. PARRP1]
MELSGETLIPAPIATVWAGLNDPAILRACIPGCEALEMTSPTEMTARVVQKIGPVSASFAGQVTLSDLNPPHSYRITGQGSGGVAGFAKGSALINLAEEDGGTRLTYTVDVALGGKIAQLGGRMIKGLANSLAAQFFQKFSDHVSGNAGAVAAVAQSGKQPARGVAATGAAVRNTTPQDGPGWRLFALAGWSTAAVLAVIALLQAAH